MAAPSSSLVPAARYGNGRPDTYADLRVRLEALQERRRAAYIVR